MITVLTGDKISSGDAFIVKRGLAHLRHLIGGEELLKLPAWQALDGHLERINSGRCVVLFGGPAVQADIYPRIYPLTSTLERITVPIVAMGLGSSLRPYNYATEEAFQFTASSQLLVERMRRDHPIFSVRDHITQRILARSGLADAKVTGCPSLFAPDHGTEPVTSAPVETVAFSTGVGHLVSRSAFEQHVGVMDLLVSRFPHARGLCVFQDTLAGDAFKADSQIRKQLTLANEAVARGFQIVDCTGNVDRMIATYRNADLLVGYRVHSHVCALTVGKPSILVAEDSRGVGMNTLLGLPVISAFDTGPLRASPWHVRRGLVGKVVRRLAPLRARPELLRDLSHELDRIFDLGEACFGHVPSVIERCRQITAGFVASWPGSP